MKIIQLYKTAGFKKNRKTHRRKRYKTQVIFLPGVFNKQYRDILRRIAKAKEGL